ncbi:hypothetical protein, partial [Streptomyces sp. BF23-30]|uniref:hypothetical protein n=1 Tax=Streptomyces sp. BF23-30 TaxID=3240281 RepID=UPI0034E5CA40
MPHARTHLPFRPGESLYGYYNRLFWIDDKVRHPWIAQVFSVRSGPPSRSPRAKPSTPGEAGWWWNRRKSAADARRATGGGGGPALAA